MGQLTTLFNYVVPPEQLSRSTPWERLDWFLTCGIRIIPKTTNQAIALLVSLDVGKIKRLRPLLNQNNTSNLKKVRNSKEPIILMNIIGRFEKYGLNIDWLLTGHGKYYKDILNTAYTEKVMKTLLEFIQVEKKGELYREILLLLYQNSMKIYERHSSNKTGFKDDFNQLYWANLGDKFHDFGVCVRDFNAMFNRSIDMCFEKRTEWGFAALYQAESATYYGFLENSLIYESCLVRLRDMKMLTIWIDRVMMEPVCYFFEEREIEFAYLFLHLKTIIKLDLCKMAPTAYISAEAGIRLKNDDRHVDVRTANVRWVTDLGAFFVQVDGTRPLGAIFSNDQEVMSKEHELIMKSKKFNEGFEAHTKRCFNKMLAGLPIFFAKYDLKLLKKTLLEITVMAAVEEYRIIYKEAFATEIVINYDTHIRAYKRLIED